MPEGCESCVASDANNNPRFGGQGLQQQQGMSSSSSSSSGYTGSSGGSSGQRRVQVTAKILFGSVAAISNMKASEKASRKRSQ